MKKLLAHSKTKGELTTFLAKNVKDNANGGPVVVAGERNVRQRTWTSRIYKVHKKKPTRRFFHMLWMPLLKVLPNSLYILLTLMLFWLSDGIQICAQTLALLLGTSSSRRVINLKSIVDALGPTKMAAMPSFDALTGADVTGSFSGKGKATCWDEFDDASTPILQALANLSCEEQPDDGTRSGVGQLLCWMYQPKTDIKTVKALRWSLFKKNQAESKRLPPTQAALHQAILRAHYQLLVWNNDHVANPMLSSPEGY